MIAPRSRAPGSRAILAFALAAPVLGCLQTVVLEAPVGDAGTGGAVFAGSGGADGGIGSSGWCPSGPLASLSPMVRSPDLVIAFDRSSSMNGRFGDGTRLSVTQATLRQQVTAYQKAIRFGYEEFPSVSSTCFDTTGCCAGDVAVAPSPQNDVLIERAMNACASYPGGCVVSDASPSGSAIARTRDFYSYFDDHAPDRYVLLLTDGEPTCSNDGNPDPDAICNQATFEIAKLHDAGVETIVVGIGEDIVGSVCLDNMALAGGNVAQAASAPFFYPARDPTQLAASLASVLGGLARSECRINLRSPSSDPTSVQLLITGKMIPRDATEKNGWNFDPGSSVRITVFGPACDLLLTTDPNDPNEIEVLGCPMGPQH